MMLRLRTVPGLRAYYAAATTARVGDEMVGVAVVLLVLDRTGSAQLAGAVVGAYLIPTVLSGPLLGAWLDRTRYRRAALAVNQVLLALVMAALVATVGAAAPWAVLAMAAAVGASVPMTSGGFTSLLPRFVPAALLGRAHALEGVSFNAAAICGPAVAATLAAAVSPAVAVLAIAGFALFSLAAMSGIPAGRAVAVAGPRHSYVAAVRDGLSHLIRTAPLRSVTVATSVAFIGVGMLTVALPVLAAELTGEAAFGGYVWTALEAGAVVAALAWGRWHARWRPERVVLATLVGSGLVMLSWAVTTQFAVLVMLAVLAGLASGAGMPALFTTRQRHAPAHRYAQISTTGASLKLGAFALGAALGGQLVPVLGAAAVIAVTAGFQLLGAVAGAVAGRSAGSANRPHVAEPAQK
jgi:MFS family permease